MHPSISLARVTLSAASPAGALPTTAAGVPAASASSSGFGKVASFLLAAVFVTAGWAQPVHATAPTVTSIVRTTNYPPRERTTSDKLEWQLTFSEAVHSVDTVDFTLAGTTATLAVEAKVTGSDTSETVYDLAASGGDLANLDGTVTLGFASGQNIEDSDGNALTATTPTGTNNNSYVLDNTAPTLVSIKRHSPADDTTAADVLIWRLTFSEQVFDVWADVGDVDPTDDFNDFKLTISPAPTNAPTVKTTRVGGYDLNDNPAYPVSNVFEVEAYGGDLATLDGDVTLTTSDDCSFVDTADLYLLQYGPNTLDCSGTGPLTPTGDNESTYTVINPPPTVAITGVPSLANAAFTATFTFSHAVTGFEVGDVTLTNATASAFTNKTPGAAWTALITPTADGAYDVSVAASVATDAGDRGNVASATHSGVYDTTVPGVTITGVPSRVNGAFTATFTFSKAVSGFVVGDVTLTGATASAFTETVTGATWTALITPTADYSVSVAANVATDALNNDNTASATHSGAYDTTAPTVEITGVLHVAYGSFIATFTFSEPMRDFVVGDITLVNATASEFTETVAGTAWTARITPTEDGRFHVSVEDVDVADLAGNGNRGSVTYGGTFINVSPGVTSIERNDPSTSPTSASVVVWKVTFEEDVQGVAAADFEISGTTATLAVDSLGTDPATGIGAVYLVRASGGNLANYNGPVTLSFAEGYSIQDVDGNQMTDPTPEGTNEPTYVMDNDGTVETPGLTLSATALTVAEGATKTYTVALDAAPSGDVTVAVASGNAAAATVSPASLAFTTANWNTAQTVTVTGVEDADARDGSATITHTASGPTEYAGLNVALKVSVDDDDVVKATVVVKSTNRAPVFAVASYAFDLSENVAGPVSLGGVSASDPDGAAPSYSLSGDGAATFTVDAAGAITYTGLGEDFETGPVSYAFTASATDAGGLFATATVTVTVTNANEAPIFAASSYAFDLSENAPGPVRLGAVSTSDPDEGDTPLYSLSGDGSASFTVDAAGAVAYTGSGEDFEAGPVSYAFTAVATDADSLFATATVTVTVTNANETPVFAASSYAFDLSENAPGAVRLGAVSTSDPDEGDTPSYSLSGDGASAFTVDAAGAVSYAGLGEDFESGPGVYELTAVATDAEGLSVSAPVTVTVTNVNEAPVFAAAGYALDLAENLAGPVSLGGVSATDPDEGDTPLYSLSGDGSASFSVDAAGTVSYTGSGEDFEAGQGVYELTATATDAGGLSATATVTVTVIDANEAPVFAVASYAFDLAENLAGPVSLGGVSATDPDGDAPSYSLSGDGASSFSMDAGGAVTYTGSGEDFETGPGAYELTAGATDADGLFGAAPVTVTVTNVNEAPEPLGVSPKVLEAYGASATYDLSGFFRDDDGDALAYAASSSRYDVAGTNVSGSHLTVRPLVIGVALVTITATDPGGLSATQTLTVTVEASRSDRARSMKLSLAAFGRTVGAEAVEAIAGRLDAGGGWPIGSHLRVGGRSLSCGGIFAGEGCGLSRLLADASRLLGAQRLHAALSNGSEGFINALLPGGGPGSQDDRGADGRNGRNGRGGFRGPPAADGPAVADGRSGPKRPIALAGFRSSPVSREALLSETSFQFSTVGSQAREGTAAGFTLWGRAGAGGFEGSPDDGFTMSGRTRSAYLGGDYRFSAEALAGLALSHTSGSIDFSSAVNGDGTLEPRVLGVHPYVRWSPAAGLDVWGVAGAGRGSADLTETGGGAFATDLSMMMGAMGARRALTGGFALRADAYSVRLVTDEAANLIGVTANARRVRLAPEVSVAWGSGGSSYRATLEVGARLDGGDAESGMGAEAAGAFGYDHAGSGLSLEARGRTLLAHQDDDFRDWGASVVFRLRPGGDEGLSLSVTPEWGGAATSTDALWKSDDVIGGGLQRSGATAAGGSPGRLNAEVGYLLPIARRGRLEPFGRWRRDGGNGYRLNAGIRLSILDAPDGNARDARFKVILTGGQGDASAFRPVDRWLGLQGRIALD